MLGISLWTRYCCCCYIFTRELVIVTNSGSNENRNLDSRNNFIIIIIIIIYYNQRLIDLLSEVSSFVTSLNNIYLSNNVNLSNDNCNYNSDSIIENNIDNSSSNNIDSDNSSFNRHRKTDLTKRVNAENAVRQSSRDSAISNNDNNFVTWILLKVNFKSLFLFNYQKEILLYPL